MLTLRGFSLELTDRRLPQTVAHIKREHVEARIAGLTPRLKSATSQSRFKAVRPCFMRRLTAGERRPAPGAP